MDIFLKADFVQMNKIYFTNDSGEFTFECNQFDLLEIEKVIKDHYDILDNDYIILHFSLTSREGNEISILIGENPGNPILTKELHFSTGGKEGGSHGIKTFGIFSNKIQKVVFHSVNINHLVSYRYTDDSINIDIFDSNIGKIGFTNKTNLRMLRSSIDNLMTAGESFEIELSIEESKIKRLNMSNLVLKSLILKDSIINSGKVIKSTLYETQITDSDLGDLAFLHIKFKEPVKISRSNILYTKFIGVTWNKMCLQEEGVDFDDIRNIYQQIKFGMDEIGNKVEANKFYEKEMEYYRKSLWEEKPRKWQKIIISYLNDLISDYGLNWWRAFKFYLFFCLFIYIAHELIRVHNLNVYSLLSGIVEFWQNNWNNIARLNWNNSQFNEFASFLNPLPDLKEEKTILGLLFSTLKILIVYQIVVALRRISQR